MLAPRLQDLLMLKVESSRFCQVLHTVFSSQSQPQALLPALRATEGDAAAVEWMNGLMQRTQDPEVKRRLAQLQA
jgi:hypothetical protein